MTAKMTTPEETDSASSSRRKGESINENSMGSINNGNSLRLVLYEKD